MYVLSHELSGGTLYAVVDSSNTEPASYALRKVHVVAQASPATFTLSRASAVNPTFETVAFPSPIRGNGGTNPPWRKVAASVTFGGESLCQYRLPVDSSLFLDFSDEPFEFTDTGETTGRFLQYSITPDQTGGTALINLFGEEYY